MSVTILRGDARQLPLPDGSVDLIVTSPPYWALRSYTDGGEHYEGQIGAEPTPAEYIDNLIECTREWMRVLKPGGSMWVNLGDKYSERGGPARAGGVDGKQVNHRAARPRRRGACETGIPAKSLMMLPERYRIACVDQLSLIARAVVIWHKPNGLPESVTDRVRRAHEDWVHLVKQPRYFAAVDAIRDQYAPGTAQRYATGYKQGDASASGQTRNGVLRADNCGPSATNPLGKLPGSVRTVATQPLKAPSHYIVQAGRTVHYTWNLPEAWAWMRARGSAAGRPSARKMTDHFAAFPMEWPRWIITGWTPAGICTACGEGRRPVTVTNLGRKERNTPAYGAGKHGTGGNTLGSRGPSAIIVGHACACTPYIDRKRGRYTEHARNLDPAGPGPRREYLFDQWQPAPVLPSVVVDPFGGTGTTALVAHALGRHGITVDMSADYCRLGAWRTTDPGQLERATRPPRGTPARRLTVKKAPAKKAARKATGPRIHPWDQPFPLFAEAAGHA